MRFEIYWGTRKGTRAVYIHSTTMSCEMKRMNSENSENSENAMRRVKYSVLATIILRHMEKNKENKEVRTSKVKTDFYNFLYLNL